jgi:uncharacterized cupin superfamily protein
MPKIDISRATVRTTSSYPAKFKSICHGREKRVLGDLAGLSQFGVNLTRLAPGAASAHRHWHAAEDEFVYMLEGELVLIEDGGETLLRPGDAAGFKAGVANGHHLVNKSDRDAVFLEVGTRAPRDRGDYPDVDLVYHKQDGRVHFTKKTGEPYP